MKTWVQEVWKSIFDEMELNTFLGSPTYNKYQNASFFTFEIWKKMFFQGVGKTLSVTIPSAQSA